MPPKSTRTPGVPISAVAATTGLTRHTLRYYEDLGLITDIERSSSGHRTYSAADIRWIEFLLRLRETAMPIDEMRQFADLRRLGPSTAPDRQQLLEVHRIRVHAAQATLTDNLEAIDSKIAYYDDIVTTQTTPT